MAHPERFGPRLFEGIDMGAANERRIGDDLRNRGSEWTARGREQLEGQTAGLRDALDEVREILRETVEEGKEVLREAVSEGRTAINREQQDLQNRFESAREGRPPEGIPPQA